MEIPGKLNQVPDRIARLIESLHLQNEIITELESRLIPVVRSEPCATNQPNQPPKASYVPLAESIDSATEKIESSNDRIANLLNKLEL